MATGLVTAVTGLLPTGRLPIHSRAVPRTAPHETRKELGTMTGKEREIRIELIDPHPRQPRLAFDPESIAQLAESLKAPGIGLLHRIIVRPKDKRFELLAGERRVRAAKQAGWETIPATIRTVDDKTALKILLLENVERLALNPLEQAFVLSELQRPIDEGGAGMTLDEIADDFKRSRTWVEQKLNLLTLKEPWRSRLISGEMDESKAEIVCRYNNEPAVQAAIDGAIQEHPQAWTTRQQWRCNAAAIAREVNRPASQTSKPSKPSKGKRKNGKPASKPNPSPPPVLDRTMTDRAVSDLLKPYSNNRGDLRAIRDTAQRFLDRIADRQAQAG